MPINVWARLVGCTALNGFSRLAELQVDPRAEPAALLDIRSAVDDDRGLLDAEDVVARVVGAQEVDPIVRPVPIELVVALERHAKEHVPERIGRVRRGL